MLAVIGLLLVALVCIVLGAVFASGPLFLASLLASAGGGYLLWRQREQIGTGGAPADGAATPQRSPAQLAPSMAGRAGQVAAGPAPTSSASIGSASNGSASNGSASNGSASNGSASNGSVSNGSVSNGSVSNGSVSNGSVSNGSASNGNALDGSRPDGGASISDGHLPGDTQVWVIDGEPQFHAQQCGRISGGDIEAIPYTQAVEDGFTRCTDCLARA